MHHSRRIRESGRRREGTSAIGGLAGSPIDLHLSRAFQNIFLPFILCPARLPDAHARPHWLRYILRFAVSWQMSLYVLTVFYPTDPAGRFIT
ncbi:hypothetical protein N657DRAFT_471579 [Parathielavia appendiculata]|uniref:Uncharacterized protein n=1 Tax=Parathielavia appendiculata TaxID=2587402 RepID=A0AAN6TXQ5_9PEZI|nr:hypothetical protein N657DRAFT_471579 [Parathielavia appendiculata]